VTPLVKLPKPISPKIYLSDKEINEASRFLERKNVSQSPRVVMISILGSELGKTYPFSYMALLLDEFTKVSQATLLFNYIPSQLAHVNAIYNLCNTKTKKQIRRDVYAPSLRSFLGVLSHCDALIGNEGGAVNMAKALQIPTFAIFSPWIKKENWNVSDNEKEHTSIHLKDYYPNRYSNQNRKSLKKQTQELYHIFEPDLFLDKLKKFIKHNLS
jgi:heptosyltransferase-2